MNLPISDLLPQPDQVLHDQGLKKGAQVRELIYNLAEDALGIFSLTARPKGLLSKCSLDEFEGIFFGEGKNAAENPLENIYPKADHLALFALTMSHEVDLKIRELFETEDFALGAMVDSAASMATDRAVKIAENGFYSNLSKDSSGSPDLCVLSYSPGYCGWDITGQRRLFEFLKPEKIGITLNESFLMTPLKSVTGVLVAGGKKIHMFKNNFRFCRDCKDPTCQERMKRILN